MHRGTVHDDGGSNLTGAPTGYIYVVRDFDDDNKIVIPSIATFIPFVNDQGLHVGALVDFKDEFVPSDPKTKRPQLRYAIDVTEVDPHEH